ncbi:HEPN domain-containing protein [bacterium]|nr:HEPN domain-containing protein [bacterium]
MKNVTKRWIDLADYDLASAKVMLDSDRYLYVTFMCQQAVEKYIKAHLTEANEEMPPYTHNLTVLFELSKINFTEQEFNLASTLTRYYINTRYPGIKEKLSKVLNEQVATGLYNDTKEIIECIKSKLKI